MKVLIADDHLIVRECLKLILKDVEEIEVVGEANNGKALLELFISKKPDVILSDISMPEMNGLEVMKELKSKYNFTKVIALTMITDSRVLEQMLEAGASGYISKNSGKEEIVTAISTVNSGNKYISPSISLDILNSYDHKATTYPKQKTNGAR